MERGPKIALYVIAVTLPLMLAALLFLTYMTFTINGNIMVDLSLLRNSLPEIAKMAR